MASGVIALMHEPTMRNASEVIAEAEQVAGTARASFAHLSSEQLNWKPSATEWSIAQCLEHLILLNSSYFPRIERILAGERSTSVWERVPLLPALFGRLVLSAVQPESQRKITARPAFAPASGLIDIGILTRFLAQQEKLIRLMKASMQLPIERIIITSTVSPVVTYSLSDAYRILIAHERRHFRQAERVMSAQGCHARA